MTKLIIKYFLKSALLKPVFLIPLIILLLLLPAPAFASGDSEPATESCSAEQSDEPEISAPTDLIDSPTVVDEDTTVDLFDTIAYDDTETTATETGINETSDTDGNDPSEEHELAPSETTVTDADTVPASEGETTTLYFQVAEESMNPLLPPGSILEIVSETYTDGDLVVAQKEDGTYIIKMLAGDQLVSLSAGTTHAVADVTILGAVTLSALTQAELELNGLSLNSVLAETSEVPTWGDGSAGDPYQIAIWENLYWLSQNWVDGEWTENYIQTADITFPDDITDWDNYKGWTPIGTSGPDNHFTGTYNGNGFTISNLFINRPAADMQGLFGYTAGATLTNIDLVEVNVTGNDYVGGLVGYNTSGAITSSSATGAVTGTDYVGGLAGMLDIGNISNSYADVAVTGTSRVGGLVGYNYFGSISNSSAPGAVTGTGANSGTGYVGGLVGVLDGGSISNSSATGAVTGNWYVGGLVGLNIQGGTIFNSSADGAVTGTISVGGLVGQSEEGPISNSYATGTVTGTDDVGGLVGYNYIGTISNSYATGEVRGDWNVGGLVGENRGTINNSYAAGAVTGNWDVGGLVGKNAIESVENNSFYDRETTHQSDSGKGTPKSTAEMKTLATYLDAGWDIDGYNGSYPVLGWQVGESSTWYMSILDTGSGDSFDLVSDLLTQPDLRLTALTNKINPLITPRIITSGNWNDFYQAFAAYQTALVYLESNRATLSPAKLALLEVELAIARAAILAMEARLLAADGLPYNLAALEAVYAEAVATLNAYQSFLGTNQLKVANQLLAAIASIIAALQ